VSGLVIGFRTLLGPLTFPLKVTNPVNPEGWFGFALVLTMLVTVDAVENTSQGPGQRYSRTNLSVVASLI
jgi:hypothetical protein